MPKKETTWKIKKQHFKTEKNRKQNKWGTKRNVKKGKTWEQMDLSICIFLHLFCFFGLLFLLAFFCIFPGKKQNKCKIKANRENKINANGQVNFFPSFSSLFDFPSFPLFFPFYFAFVFFGFCWFAFCFFSIFLHLSRFFSSLLILRISYSLVNIRRVLLQ